MIEITFSAADFEHLEEHLVGDVVERCAILYAAQTRRTDGLVRLLVGEIEFPAEADYQCQSEYRVVLRPEFVARVTKRAQRARHSLIFAHSHPGTSSPSFSWTDDDGEEHLARFLHHRHPGNVHAALVLSRGGLRARELGVRPEGRVVSLGERRIVLFEPAKTSGPVSSQFDRQVMALGKAGQHLIGQLRVAIVGLGGTGSLIAEQLAHLGVRDFILIDPDLVEETNLNRVVGATECDVGRPKVEVASALIRRIAANSSVSASQDNVVLTRTAHLLTEADFVFGCTDSHGSRAVLQQVSYQYLIPCIDMGSAITTSDGAIGSIFGRVQLLAPGLACLNCSNLLDSEQVRRDMMSSFERSLDPYIFGERVPAPSVISINGTVSSLAVTMFMAVVTGLPIPARHILYNGLSSMLRSVRVAPAHNCYVCSKQGVLARGDAVSLFARDE